MTARRVLKEMRKCVVDRGADCARRSLSPDAYSTRQHVLSDCRKKVYRRSKVQLRLGVC
jgi:hypothetical protein